MRSFSLLHPFCHVGRRTLTGLLLGTVSTLGFIQVAQAADTQSISGTYSGSSVDQAYDGSVTVDGLLTLRSGAKLKATEMIAGPAPDGAARVTVMNSGSSLVTTGNLIVGAASEAYTGSTLSVASGGSVNAGTIIAGQGDGTLGTVNVTGYNNGDTTRLTTHDLYLGTEGGNAALNIGGQGTGVATVRVDGQLVIGKPDADGGLGANTVLVSSGGVLEVGGTNGIQASGTRSDYTFTLAGGTLRTIGSDLTTAANITLGRTTGGSTLDTGSFNTTVNGNVSGSSNLIKTGTGTLTLTGDTQYAHGTGSPANTFIQEGTLAGSPLSVRGVGTIENNSTLLLDQGLYTGSTTTWRDMLFNKVTGTGQLVKAGAAMVTLTADNTYTGATIVREGVLQLGTGEKTGSIAGTSRIDLLDPSSNLTVYRASDLTIAAPISGAGSLTQKGSANLTLIGVNTYSGGTSIQNGTITGTTRSFGTGAIEVAAGTTLALDQSTNGTLSNTVNGAGHVMKQGTGNVTLGAVNTYTGGTSIQSGTLTGTPQSFGDGAIYTATGATLDVASAGSLGNALSGAGAFAKTADGTLSYTGDGSAFTGMTDVKQGTLSVEGNLQQSSVNVESGATLSGTGSVGNTSVQGTFAPGLGGGTFGSLHVAGNVSMSGGSTFAANVGSDLRTSQAVVSGVFAIDPGATLSVTAQQDAALSIGQHYILVQAQGGVTGQFDHYDQTGLIKTHSLLLMAQPAYTSDEVQLVVARNTNLSFGYGSSMRNQMAAGYGLDGLALTAGGLNVTNTVAGLSDEQRYRALNALSGEIHASAKTAMINDAFYIRDAALDRLDCADDALRQISSDQKAGACRSASGRPVTVWGTVYGAKGQNSGTASAARLSNSSVGWIMGADTTVGQWRVGGLLAYGRTMFSNEGGRNSSGHSNNATLGAYGGTGWRYRMACWRRDA